MSIAEVPSEAWSVQWDLADRLNKALRIAGLKPRDMAGHLDVHRNTISGWLSGRNLPKVAVLRTWAHRCNVPFEWLAYGEVTGDEVRMTQSRWIARSRPVVLDRSQLAFWPRRVA